MLLGLLSQVSGLGAEGGGEEREGGDMKEGELPPKADKLKG